MDSSSATTFTVLGVSPNGGLQQNPHLPEMLCKKLEVVQFVLKSLSMLYRQKYFLRVQQRTTLLKATLNRKRISLANALTMEKATAHLNILVFIHT